MSLNPGTRLGPYEVGEQIGAGGMGEVYKARDPRLGRDVAIKVIAATPDSDLLARFERETRATAVLAHPNILTIFDVGSHDGLPFLVSELLDGQTLGRWRFSSFEASRPRTRCASCTAISSRTTCSSPAAAR
jgi:eukaryotic-like serine/threonine-protein kinase